MQDTSYQDVREVYIGSFENEEALRTLESLTSGVPVVSLGYDRPTDLFAAFCRSKGWDWEPHCFQVNPGRVPSGVSAPLEQSVFRSFKNTTSWSLPLSYKNEKLEELIGPLVSGGSRVKMIGEFNSSVKSDLSFGSETSDESRRVVLNWEGKLDPEFLKSCLSLGVSEVSEVSPGNQASWVSYYTQNKSWLEVIPENIKKSVVLNKLRLKEQKGFSVDLTPLITLKTFETIWPLLTRETFPFLVFFDKPGFDVGSPKGVNSPNDLVTLMKLPWQQRSV